MCGMNKKDLQSYTGTQNLMIKSDTPSLIVTDPKIEDNNIK